MKFKIIGYFLLSVTLLTSCTEDATEEKEFTPVLANKLAVSYSGSLYLFDADQQLIRITDPGKLVLDQVFFQSITVPDSIIFSSNTTARLFYTNTRPEADNLNGENSAYSVQSEGNSITLSPVFTDRELPVYEFFQTGDQLTGVACFLKLKKKNGETLNNYLFGSQYKESPLPVTLEEGDSLEVYNYNITYQ